MSTQHKDIKIININIYEYIYICMPPTSENLSIQIRIDCCWQREIAVH
jgi:hypothetical protein